MLQNHKILRHADEDEGISPPELSSECASTPQRVSAYDTEVQSRTSLLIRRREEEDMKKEDPGAASPGTFNHLKLGPNRGRVSQ